MAQMRSLVESEFGRGAWNMAVDCAIVDAVAAGEQPATLRLYGWAPFCLSLGYGQRLRDVDLQALHAHGWDLVRRPSGGKAILHGDELTYSLCLPLGHPWAAGDVVESYRRISIGLMRAMNGLGAKVRAGQQGGARSQAGPVCFEIASHYEITVENRKLIGSAQLRRKGVLLQHGSLPLKGDVARICDVLELGTKPEREARKPKVRRSAIALNEALGREPSWDEVAQAIVQGFNQSLDEPLARGQLSVSEIARAKAYQSERFAKPVWTNKR